MQALREQMQMPDCTALTFDGHLGVLMDDEVIERENRRLAP